jgi:galactokinase
VITENRRTLDAADAMRQGDAASLGRLMNESHVSLRDDFEVSGPGLDSIVEVALRAPGCLGARMTGGGFAGCAVALVRTDEAERFERSVLDRYRYDGHVARVWICAPASGSAVIPLDRLPA